MSEPALAGLDTGFLRPESVAALRSALVWGLPRCRTDAARSLFLPLLSLLGWLNATVLPVDRDDGMAVNFRVTFARTEPDGRPYRVRFALYSSVPESTLPPTEDEENGSAAGEHSLSVFYVNERDSLDSPWETAGAVIGEMLQNLALRSY